MMRVRVRQWVERFHDSFDAERALAEVRSLCRHDRFPASEGIQAAAAEVAERAVAAGLRDVEIRQFPATGERSWWTFRAPRPWSPRAAELTLLRTGTRSGVPSDRLRLRYPDQPFTLAAGSTATPDGGVTAPLVSVYDRLPTTGLAGSVAVLACSGFSWPVVCEQLARRGVLGVVAVSPTGGESQIGRLELPPGSPLFAFSVTPSQRQALASHARRGGLVRVEVRTGPAATMPVVIGSWPGSDDDSELLVCAHLCHPSPGANDNASGAVAALGVARALARVSGPRPARGVRFVWGPEFVGMAAFLHDVVLVGGAPVPKAAINLDMVGEDQRLCGGPLIVERAPDHLPTWLNALVEECVAVLPQAGASYSGAVRCDTWTWRATPFVGASDHCLLVDRSIGCPAVQLGHWPDRFNHSSADTPDKVDAMELRRSVSVAAATAAVFCHPGEDTPAELRHLLVRWVTDRLADCLPGREVRNRRVGWIDPRDRDLAVQCLDQRARVAHGCVSALAAAFPDRPAEYRSVREWLDALVDSLLRRLPGGRQELVDGAAALTATWPGPFNLRGLSEAASRRDRDWMSAQLSRDRSRSYATMLALAHAIDGTTGRHALITRAAFSSQLPIRIATAERFFDVLLGTEWASSA
jgi:hypothetical protein